MNLHKISRNELECLFEKLVGQVSELLEEIEITESSPYCQTYIDSDLISQIKEDLNKIVNE